ncbi:MAG: hypothetical protein M3Z83_04545 [Actinomycetota bacterium]|nr:hypothetical protein [Actinomycetota bacterium]
MPEWSNGNNAIGFDWEGIGRVDKESSSVTQQFQTSLPAGRYCDVIHGDRLERLLHRPDVCRGVRGDVLGQCRGAACAVNATTSPGQDISVVGDVPALGGWNAGQALKLSPTAYPVWKLDMALPAGTTIQYKYAARRGGLI